MSMLGICVHASAAAAATAAAATDVASAADAAAGFLFFEAENFLNTKFKTHKLKTYNL